MPKLIKGKSCLVREEGLTLLELVVSLALLSITLLSFANLLSSSLAAAVQAGRITQAALLAQQRMETLLGISFEELVVRGADAGENGIPVAVYDFDNFSCCQSIAGESLVLGGYRIDGLRLVVEVAGEGERVAARFVTFVHGGPR